MLWHSHEVHETHSVKPHPSSDELSDATRSGSLTAERYRH